MKKDNRYAEFDCNEIADIFRKGYLVFYCVQSDKTKIRVVFDAAAKTNGMLHETVLFNSLFGMLLNFRIGRIINGFSDKIVQSQRLRETKIQNDFC